MMNGTTRRPEIKAPLTAPHSPPNPTPSSMAIGMETFHARSVSGRTGSTFFMKSAMQTVTSATVEPTDRSIPPAIMMRVMPRAAVPTITVWTAIVRPFSADRNCPDSRVSTANRAVIRTRPTNGPKTVQPQPMILRKEIGLADETGRSSVGCWDNAMVLAGGCLRSRPPQSAPSARVATSMTRCSVHRSTGRASVRWPRDITAIRSQMPNSSGRYELTTRMAFPCAASSPIRR